MSFTEKVVFCSVAFRATAATSVNPDQIDSLLSSHMSKNLIVFSLAFGTKQSD